jgi:hypothetical protein
LISPDFVDVENTDSDFRKTFLDPTGDPWASGDGSPGIPLAAGFAAAVATWHFFILVAQDGSAYDFGWDTSLTATNLRADADVIVALGSNCYYRRIRSNVSTTTPDFATFTQVGDETILYVPVIDYNDVTANITSAETVVLASVPNGIQVKALIRVSNQASAADTLLVRSSLETDAAPTPTTAPLASVFQEVGTNAEGGEMEVWTTTSRQIYMRQQSDTTTNKYILTRGWIDRRGRDD